MDKYKTTIATWNNIAKRYEEVFMNFELYDDSYNTFCNSIVKQNPSILEVGCGPGNITKYISQKRPDFTILATDVAPNMLTLAKQNVPTATFKKLDARHLSQLKTTFNGIICGFCLPYLNKKDCIGFLKDSYALLESKGLLYFSIIEGDYNDSYYQTGSTGDQVFVHYYNEAFVKEQLITLGFKDLQIIKKPFVTSQGETQVHLVILAKKK